MLRTLALALCAALVPAAVQSQAAAVEFDHATGAARLIVGKGGGADTTILGRSPIVRLDRSVPVVIRVVNTNTAFYRFSEESETAPLPELESFRAFMGRFTPYLPELRASAMRALRPRGGGSAPEAEAVARAIDATSESLRKVRTSLVSIDQAVFGTGGLQDQTTRALFALEQMRRGTPPEVAAAPVRQIAAITATCGSQQPVRLPTASSLLTALVVLPQATQELRDTIAAASHLTDERLTVLRDSARVLEGQAQTALSDFDALVTAAYRAERLVGIVGNACSSWTSRSFTGSRTEGRTVTVKVEPRLEPELGRHADRGTATHEVKIQPRTFARPLLSPAAMVAPSARFAKYGTRPATGAIEGAEVYETGSRDNRFAIGASLGFTWPGLDRRESGGLTFWLPDLMVGKGSGTHAFGVGPAVSWGFFKIGGGALWVHHPALKRARVGDILPEGTDAPLEEVYGPPRAYVAVSVLSMPLQLPGLR